MAKRKVVQQAFEARYERGYRYLDRCGEALLILEESLPAETGKVWLLDQATPQGATLKCPELDTVIGFDSMHVTIDQTPVDVDFALADISAVVLAILSARFDLRSFTRFGYRRFYLLGADSVEQSEELSIRYSPFKNWPVEPISPMKARAYEATSVFEDDDGSGYRFSMRSAWRIEAPLQVDPRLLAPARLLDKNQKQALIEQMHRRSQREKNPIAGLVLDIDCYQIRPPKPDASRFVANAIQQSDLLVHDFGRE